MDRSIKSTSLSVGYIVWDVLTNNPAVKVRANKVFPVVVDNAELPYIVYRRALLQQNPVKAGMAGADTVTIEVLCFTKGYSDGVEMAEAVRGALDGRQYSTEDLAMRSCMLTDSEELWQDDAYVQKLVFSIKV